MKNLLTQLINDEAGFIVSAELILISTIAVLAMVVGLSEVSQAVNQELEDVGSAFGSIQQSVSYSGTQGHFGQITGSRFNDRPDFCDGPNDINATSPTSEGGDFGGNNGGGYDY